MMTRRVADFQELAFDQQNIALGRNLAGLLFHREISGEPATALVSASRFPYRPLLFDDMSIWR
jgi:hypothetical protein